MPIEIDQCSNTNITGDVISVAKTNIMNYETLEQLFETGDGNDSFGPESPHPCVVFEADDDDISGEFAQWLAERPCVVCVISNQLEELPDCLSYVADVVVDTTTDADYIAQIVMNYPVASLVLTQHLRLIEKLDFEAALTAESFAYALLQGGGEFKNWLANKETPAESYVSLSPLSVTREAQHLNLRLNAPESHNEIDIHLRDALCEAFELASIDETIETLSITAIGKSFSIGGAISEFGHVIDPATAHWIRSVRLPGRLLARLVWRDNPVHVQTYLNGPAIGAGLELAAFAHELTAHPKAWTQLPEIRMGLIPGAGGTVSVSRRIGRHKTAYMVLTGKRIKAETAYKWGLIDNIEIRMVT